MREVLGFCFNCPKANCAQDWLSYSVDELYPDSEAVRGVVHCSGCGQDVIVAQSLDACIKEKGLTVVPVMPCTTRIPKTPDPKMKANVGGDINQAFVQEPVNIQDPFGATPAILSEANVIGKKPTREHQWVCVLGNGDEIRIERSGMVIGRSRASDIILPSAKVSRQHASLLLEGTRLKIEDLGSANGVWFKNEKVQTREVQPGDSYVLSDEQIRFEYRPMQTR